MSTQKLAIRALHVGKYLRPTASRRIFSLLADIGDKKTIYCTPDNGSTPKINGGTAKSLWGWARFNMVYRWSRGHRALNPALEATYTTMNEWVLT